MAIHGKTASEIFDSVRVQVQSGQLRAEQSLPPVRELALALGVNRNTVAAAYRRLATAGIAVTQRRLGTVIRKQSGPGEQEGTLAGTSLLDLASGNPNPAWLPDLVAAAQHKPYTHRLYGEPTVNAGLDAYARRWFAPHCPAPFQIDLTHGAVDAIERVLATGLVAGDKVAIENPGFLSNINMLRTTGLQSVGIDIDSEGMQARALEQALAAGAQAVIVTPRAHNPTGCNLSEKRARALVRVLARYPHVLVIVDDHFALLSSAAYYSVIPQRTHRWAVIRSFTKALGPDIRIAAVASDPATSSQLRLRLSAGTNWVSHLLQDAAEVSITRPAHVRKIASAAREYTRRRTVMERALRAEGVEHIAQGEGLNVWVPLQTDDRIVSQALARRGWLVRPGEAFAVAGGIRGLRITISTIEPDQCRRLAADIRHCVQSAQADTARPA